MTETKDMSFVCFGGKIPNSIKESIDAKLEDTRVPIGVAIEKLAEFLSSMSPEEIKMFCFGTNATTFAQFINGRVTAYLQSEEGARLLHAAIAGHLAQAASRKSGSHSDRSRRLG
jgi:hypothetical protein